jgi:hypothetical protein
MFSKELEKNYRRSVDNFNNERGLQIRVSEKLLVSGIKETSVSSKNIDILQEEIDILIQKDVIEPEKVHSGFYSTFFLVAKKNGKMRPVINLRSLNSYLKKTHFKMDTLNKVINIMKPKDWALSIDLSDAYLHVPLFPKHRQYLRFCIQGSCYQWKTLCFGPTSNPLNYVI